jgi:excisionase family DNA binding protein
MSTANLTTKEVARLLQVSEATVKRWADDGLLRSNKTVGGHRRFSAHAIASLRREKGIGPASAPPRARKKNRAPSIRLSASLTESLLRGDEKGVTAFLIHAYMEGQSLVALFDQTITEAMHEVGELWFQGTITVADEHLATRVLLSALQQLRSVVVHAGPIGLNAICCGIEGDLHELPVHLAEIILESDGWDVKNLGANTPLFALRDMVTDRRPQLICIAGRTVADLDRTASEFDRLRKLTDRIGAQVTLGGEVFRDPNLRRRFPADLYAEDFHSLSRFAAAIAKRL